MANNQKFYWLKLKRDFFKRHDIRIIEQMPNGKDYVLFYLKMLLESIDHEGALRFSETIPYDHNMLSVITNTNVDMVKAAMDLFIGLGMVEILDDNTIYMNEVQKLIGSETRWAQKKRVQRQKGDNVPLLSPKCPTEIEIKIDKEKREREKSLEKEDREISGVVSLFNSICISFPQVKYLSETTEANVQALLDKYSMDDFKALFEKVEQSDFLKGENEKGWSATFDWLMQEDHMCKVLNGNYDNKKKAPKGRGGFDMEAYNNMLEKQANPPKTAADDENIRARAEALQQQLAGNEVKDIDKL